jgi:GNAT superfamily N-acetyltransferase
MINIRKANVKDLPIIMHIERRSYPSQLWAPEEVIARRMNDSGIWIAEFDGVPRGFFTSVPVRLEWPNPVVRRILKNRNPHYSPWFDEFKQGGEFNTLFVTSTAVETDFQGKGIGRALVENSLDLAKELGLDYRASALRCQYKKFFDETGRNIEGYIKEIKSGRIKDKFLGLYLKLGFSLGEPLRNYEPYKGSMNWNVLAHKRVK